MGNQKNLEEEISDLLLECKDYRFCKSDAKGTASRICQHWEYAKQQLKGDDLVNDLKTHIATAINNLPAIPTTKRIEQLIEKIQNLVLTTAGLA